MIKLVKKQKKSKKIIQESGFTSSNFERGFQLLANQLGKRLGLKVWVVPGFTLIKNSNGIYKTVSLFMSNKTEVRFNMKTQGSNMNQFEEIEFFFDGKYSVPKITLAIDLGTNILQLIDMLVMTIKNPRELQKALQEKKEDKEDDFKQWMQANSYTDDYIKSTKKSTLFKDYSYFARDNNLSQLSTPTFNKVMGEYLKSKGLKHNFDKVRPVKNKPFAFLPSAEDKELIDYIKKNENLDDLESSLDEIRIDVQVLNSRVGKSGNNLLIIYGRAGISKTNTTEDVLKELGIKYGYGRLGDDIKNSGDFYKFLYANNNKVIFLDDSDIILKNSSPYKSMMLAATDTTLKNRRLTYFNSSDSQIAKKEDMYDEDGNRKPLPRGKYPQQFQFNGAIISITNLPLVKMSDALRSRAILNEVRASDESLVAEIKAHLDEFHNDYSMKVKEEVVEFLISLRSTKTLTSLDFRHYTLMLQFFDSDIPRQLVRETLSKKLLKLKG